MKISNIKIDNFRNIVRADVKFENINIFTGRNSSGKSNLLLAISNSLRTSLDFSDRFYDNIVTFGPGKSRAIFKTTIDGLNTKWLFGTGEKDLKDLEYIFPSSFIFENTFNKKSQSPTHHKLFYSGEISFVNDSKADNEIKNLEYLNKSQKKQELDKALVYERNFGSEKIENPDNKQHVVEQIELSNFPNSEKFLSVFSSIENSLYSWIDPKTFSSTSIYKYVIERIDNNEIYEQVLNFLKENVAKPNYQKASFKKAKFIHLLADVQRSEKQKEQFNKDLKFYTDGLLTNLFVNVDGSFGNKGEIIVESPNAPKNIFYISAGTAVMVYFILIKNWSELTFEERSFSKPDIMIFDEIDCVVHPALMSKFTEILKSLSASIQLFISTHSPHFIDCFDKTQLYWLKDVLSVNEKVRPAMINNVYSYKEIIDKLQTDNDYFRNKSNSELFINGLLDSVFPLI